MTSRDQEHPAAAETDGEATVIRGQPCVSRLAKDADAALEARNWHGAAAPAAQLHAADLADLLQELSPDNREHLISLIRDGFEPETLVHLDETVREEVVE